MATPKQGTTKISGPNVKIRGGGGGGGKQFSRENPSREIISNLTLAEYDGRTTETRCKWIKSEFAPRFSFQFFFMNFAFFFSHCFFFLMNCFFVKNFFCV